MENLHAASRRFINGERKPTRKADPVAMLKSHVGALVVKPAVIDESGTVWMNAKQTAAHLAKLRVAS